MLGAFFEARIHGKGHLGYFINGRGHGGRLLEAIPGAEGLQLVRINRIHYAMEELAEFCVGDLFRRVGVIALLFGQIAQQLPHAGIARPPRRGFVETFCLQLHSLGRLLHRL